MAHSRCDNAFRSALRRSTRIVNLFSSHVMCHHSSVHFVSRKNVAVVTTLTDCCASQCMALRNWINKHLKFPDAVLSSKS